jgi:hypothetical protein
MRQQIQTPKTMPYLTHLNPYAEDPEHYGIYTYGIRDYIAY